MPIHIPTAILAPLLVLLGAGLAGMFFQQAPDMWRYLRQEGM